MIPEQNHRVSVLFLHTAVCILLFALTPVASLAQTDGEPPIQGEIMTVSKNALTVLVTEKTESDFRPGETVAVQVSRNTRIMNLQLQFISMGNLSSGDAVTVTPVPSARGEVIADMIHLRRRK